MSIPFELIQPANLDWRDGLPYAADFEDIYFSIADALAETRYVFIEGNHLFDRWSTLTDNSVFVIAETGFGTGLNFLLTWYYWQQYAPANAQLHFISCEKHPLRPDDLQRCHGAWPILHPYAEQLLAAYPVLTPGFHRLSFANARVCLTLMLGEAVEQYRELLLCGAPLLEQQTRSWFVDAWYLDGFAPAKNPTMWTQTLFSIMRLLSQPQTTVATFSAAGMVKRGLQQAGFQVMKRAGYGRKRDMLMATVADQGCIERKLRHTPWSVAPKRSLIDKRVIIVGAGLAGCFTAHALAKRGWSVKLMDAAMTVSTGASGNRQMVLYPKLSMYRSPLTQFMLSAFLLATQIYQYWLQQYPTLGELKGLLQLPYRPSEQRTQDQLLPLLAHYPALGRLLNVQQASALLNVPLPSGGLYIPAAGWLDAPAFCQILCQTPGITWLPNTNVSTLDFDNGIWSIANHAAPTVILANGYQATQFEQTAHLPLKAMHGQMTLIQATEASARLSMPLSGAAHIVPAIGGHHAVGATFTPGTDRRCTAAHDAQNLAHLTTTLPLLPSPEIIDHWAGIRTAAPDYLPLVGPVADESLFLQQFAPLATDANRWLAECGAYYPGLYVCTGFGARGLTTIPLCAEYLAALLNHEPTPIPRSLSEAIAPARFLRRALIKRDSTVMKRE